MLIMHCTLFAPDIACVCFKVSVSAVFALISYSCILQDYRLSVTLCVFCATVNVLNKNNGVERRWLTGGVVVVVAVVKWGKGKQAEP